MTAFFHALILTTALAPQASRPVSTPPTASPQDGLAVQVMLDRAGFSPGVIDGQMGTQTAKALAAFKKAGHDEQAPAEPVTRYRITDADAEGPFVTITGDLMEQSKLASLGYASLLEMLAERFHATPALLERLNPGVTFAAGQEIAVPDVEPLMLPGPAARSAEANSSKTARPATAAAQGDLIVTVSKGASALTVTDEAGKVLLYAPVTTGSEKDPLPLGEWKVNGVQRNPVFHYNPDLFWDADPSHAKAKIAAGPNNPVGVVWVDIDKEHYGLHGTPEPAKIGRAESHGCVRLTNWDALRLAALVAPGTRVVFKP